VPQALAVAASQLAGAALYARTLRGRSTGTGSFQSQLDQFDDDNERQQEKGYPVVLGMPFPWPAQKPLKQFAALTQTVAASLGQTPVRPATAEDNASVGQAVSPAAMPLLTQSVRSASTTAFQSPAPETATEETSAEPSSAGLIATATAPGLSAMLDQAVSAAAMLLPTQTAPGTSTTVHQPRSPEVVTTAILTGEAACPRPETRAGADVLTQSGSAAGSSAAAGENASLWQAVSSATLIAPMPTPVHTSTITGKGSERSATTPPGEAAFPAPARPETNPPIATAVSAQQTGNDPGEFSKSSKDEIAFEGRLGGGSTFPVFVVPQHPVNHNDPPPAPAVQAPHAPAEPDAQTAPAVRDLRLRLESPSGERAEVRVLEAAGEVRLTVRADASLSQALRENLPELKTQLERSDVQAQVWRPDAVRVTESSNVSTADTGTGQGGQQQYQPEWVEHLAREAARQKFARRKQ